MTTLSPSLLSLVKSRILRKLRPKIGARPNWEMISKDARWLTAIQDISLKKGKKILIATSTGSNWPISSFDSLLGIALTLKGADVSFLLCDGILPACQECDFQNITPNELANNGPNPSLCNDCFSPAKKMLVTLGLNIFTYSQILTDTRPVSKLVSEMMPLNSHAEAGAKRYFGVGDLKGQPFSKEILSRYHNADAISQAIGRALIDVHDFDLVIAHHGIYTPQGAIVDAFQQMKREVVTWFPSYRKGTILLSKGKSYHHTLPAETDIYVNNWNSAKKKQIKEYLQSRRGGQNDWISFNDDFAPKFQLPLLKKGIKTFGLFTNVIWDAQLHFESSAFTGLLPWLWQTIDHFINTSKHRLVIRIHPAEKKGTVPSRQPLAEEIGKRYSSLPENIILIFPDTNISSYDLADQIDIALVYGTKMAIELSCMGKPVIVAGDSWARNKGFTYDISNAEHYSKILLKPSLIKALTTTQIDLALQYAYYLFFIRMIKVTSLEPRENFMPYQVKCDSIDTIIKDCGLNSICDGILSGKDFHY